MTLFARLLYDCVRSRHSRSKKKKKNTTLGEEGGGSSNISVISWWSVLLAEETGVSGVNHRCVAITDKLYHIMLLPHSEQFHHAEAKS